MKILMLTDRLALGGAETHIAALIHGLRARGVVVEIASAGGTYAEHLERDGVCHHTIDMASHTPKAWLHAKHRLHALLRTGNYTLVHAHARLPAFLCTPICRRMHIPLVTTAHWVFRTDGWRGRLSCWGDYTLAVSEDIRRYLMESYGLSPHRIALTRNGIDTKVFYPREHEKSYNGRLIHVSRLDKGRAAAAEALICLAPQLAAVGYQGLTIVGDGNCYAALKEQADAIHGILGHDFIHMTGGVTEVAPLLREHDTFVGVSRAALEAMACGLPTILAGDEGYLSLFSPDSAPHAEASNFCCRGAPTLCKEQLFSDLAALQGDDKRRQEAGQFAAAYIEEHYRAEQMAEDALHAYRFVLKRKAPPVIICGYYGFENTGDETVLSHLIAWLKREGACEITVLSATPESTQSLHGVSACGRYALSRVREVGKNNGIFLLGGGNLLQNETSSRSLLYYTQMMQYAKRHGCRVIVIGGIGKLTEKGEKITRRALRAADLCFGRTPRDVARFQRLCQKQTPVHLLPDGALWTKPADKLPANLPTEPFILLALRGDTDQGRENAVIDACAAIARHEGLQVVLACMHLKQDTELARRAILRIPCARRLPPLTAGEWITLLQANGRLVIATRLHMLLFAAVAGVPAMTFSDGGKIDDYAAYAAKCDIGDHPMLVALQTEECIQSTIHQALHAPHSKEQRRRFLSNLRATDKGVSLLRKTESKAQKNHQ